MKKQRAVLVGEDEKGLIGFTYGDFNVSCGEAETEVTIGDIPIKIDDIEYIELSENKCINCELSFWIQKDHDARSCPFCGSGALEIIGIRDYRGSLYTRKGKNEPFRLKDLKSITPA